MIFNSLKKVSLLACAAIVAAVSFSSEAAPSFNRDRTVRDCGNYMLVWKREEGEWRIYRDIASPGVGPAPAEDRVGFPADYRTKFTVLASPALNKQGMIQTAYGNDTAA